ncbi:molybdenum cofactor biosynthesis protein MoaE [Blastopirellula sp. JC732]|uniref:Molybdopterin synthase catalytic subunit n=1 Tax=Blastopirellula sediminis TaxID=2894196 RepID=A0A9X1MKR5_9BACT|nr:molybdenum cofactor biosynthesis protein MoaE [Blastopirellula sediminis]MCC9608842.1 molybdenum cofactor biosynthesis protein MoaE [Blastopirellula sediminis]MCC9628381.1 molybdenum cofactor biosynthesis protein MoaE [Blastopirellula sediminis]
MASLTHETIDLQAMYDLVATPTAGAIVTFSGVTRELTHGRQTDSLDYEAYAEMALAKLQELEQTAKERWPIEKCAITHRLGHLEIGEASVVVAVSSPHRDASFLAAKWLIDTLKEEVPIWKRENWSDGSTEWVHPGLPTGDAS